jgi:DNA-binding response OmpR family regulator
MRILIVEDDPGISRPVADDLRRQHHIVDVAEDGVTGLDLAQAAVHDVILLDVMLPGMDGIQICRRLRETKSASLILMITARDTVSDKVSALDIGADDYLVKPFDLAELSARIRAVSRRTQAAPEPVLTHGNLRLDPNRRVLTCGDKPVHLTPTEFAILETLMRQPTRVFSRRLLQDKVSPFESTSGSETIKTHVTNIRRKVKAAGERADPIESVYGAGYRLADVER